MRKTPIILVALAAARCAFAATTAVPPPLASPFADTEVSTNIAVRADGDYARVVEVTFALPDGCASNCVQAAFGNDSNGDGVLGFDEAEVIFGWRNGRRFVEGIADGVRFEEEATGAATSRVFTVSMELSRGVGLRGFSAFDETGAPAFAGLSAAPPDWLLEPSWDMVRVTRRGPGVPAEWFSCAIRQHFIQMVLH